jgi:hypothetical protein
MLCCAAAVEPGVVTVAQSCSKPPCPNPNVKNTIFISPGARDVVEVHVAV